MTPRDRAIELTASLMWPESPPAEALGIIHRWLAAPEWSPNSAKTTVSAIEAAIQAAVDEATAEIRSELAASRRDAADWRANARSGRR